MRSTCTIVAAGALVVATLAGTAAARSLVPSPLWKALERIGVPPQAVEGLIFGRPPEGTSTSAKDPSAAALMERARQEDVTIGPQDALFDAPNLQRGLWESTAFLQDYGTALFLTAPYDEHRIPVFLVHGIGGSPRDFSNLFARFRGSVYQPVAFFYPTGMALAEASRQLGTRLQEFLRRHPTSGFGIVGHSMGGLVVKGILDQFDVARSLPAWKVFVGISSPWVGVPAAAYGDRLPVHPKSWDDLAPRSTFMRDINSTSVPSRLGFYMFFGARSSRSLLTAFGNNDGRLTVDAMMDTPLSREARDVFGFYEDHVSILSAPRVLDRLETVLAGELGGTIVHRSPGG